MLSPLPLQLHEQWTHWIAWTLMCWLCYICIHILLIWTFNPPICILSTLLHCSGLLWLENQMMYCADILMRNSKHRKLGLNLDPKTQKMVYQEHRIETYHQNSSKYHLQPSLKDPKSKWKQHLSDLSVRGSTKAPGCGAVLSRSLLAHGPGHGVASNHLTAKASYKSYNQFHRWIDWWMDGWIDL